MVFSVTLNTHCTWTVKFAELPDKPGIKVVAWGTTFPPSVILTPTRPALFEVKATVPISKYLPTGKVM